VAYLADLQVDPGYQRFKVATKLFEAIEADARELRLEHIVVRCWRRRPGDGVLPAPRLRADRCGRARQGEGMGRPALRRAAAHATREVALWVAVRSPPALPIEEESTDQGDTALDPTLDHRRNDRSILQRSDRTGAATAQLGSAPKSGGWASPAASTTS